MDLNYTEKYEKFRDEVRGFIEQHKADAVPASDALEYTDRESAKRWQALLIENGYACRTIPKEYGGYGAAPDILENVILEEEFRSAGVSRGMRGLGITLFTPTCLAHGTEEQKKEYVAATIRGDMIWCQGYSEPGSGSDLASLRTSAVEDGDEFVINGQKIWTSAAQFADKMFAMVRTDPDKGKHGGISYIVIDMHHPGVEVRPLVQMNGDASFNEVFLTDVRVPKKNLIGKRGEGWMVGNTTLKHERGMIGNPTQTADYLVALVDMMQTETRGGRKAIDNPIYRDRLMQMQARAFANKFHAMRLLTCTLKREDPGYARMITKVSGTELGYEIHQLAVDVLGEFGVLYDKSKYLRANGDWQHSGMYQLGMIIAGGTNQIQRNIIAERGLGLPRESKFLPGIAKQLAAQAAHKN